MALAAVTVSFVMVFPYVKRASHSVA
jgi:hypothetical protein